MSIDLKNPTVFDPMKNDFDQLPSEKAVYMMVAKGSASLKSLFDGSELEDCNGRSVIYIGITEEQGLRARAKNHFLSTARHSTFRKSIGSLKHWMAFRVYYNDGRYKFNDQCEKELSVWMKENLLIYYWLVEENIQKNEKDLINVMNPPLNIQNNRSQVNKDFRQRLRKLRK